PLGGHVDRGRAGADESASPLDHQGTYVDLVEARGVDAGQHAGGQAGVPEDFRGDQDQLEAATDEVGGSLESKQIGVSRTQHHGTSHHPGASLSRAELVGLCANSATMIDAHRPLREAPCFGTSRPTWRDGSSWPARSCSGPAGYFCPTGSGCSSGATTS